MRTGEQTHDEADSRVKQVSDRAEKTESLFIYRVTIKETDTFNVM